MSFQVFGRRAMRLRCRDDFCMTAVKKKVVPTPTVDSTQISPFIRPAIRLQMDRPKPVPPYFLVVVPSACLNASKIVANLFSGMPMPVSRILASSVMVSSVSA